MQKTFEKVQLGQFRDKEIWIDFTEVFYYRGSRKKKIKTDKSLGRIIFIFGLVLFLLPFFVLFLNSNLSLDVLVDGSSALPVISAFGIYPMLYGWYLNRDRNVFDIIYEDKSLKHSINEDYKRLEIENYFSTEILDLIDEIYFRYPADFLVAFFDFLLNEPNNNFLLEKRFGLDVKIFRKRLFQIFDRSKASFEQNYKEFFLRAFDMGVDLQAEKIDKHVFLITAIKYYWKDLLLKFEIGDLEISGFKEWLKNQKMRQSFEQTWKIKSKLKPTGSINRSYTSRATNTLNEFGTDFTAKVAREGFEISIGRDEEITKLLRVLQKQKGAAAVLLGDPGVGKTHFLRYLATKMVLEDVPKILQDYRFVVVDLNKVFTKTGTIDSFKQTLQDLMEEIVLSGNIIIAFEDFSQLLNIRQEGRLEVVNLILNMINQYNIKVIATTTFDSYTRQFKPLKSLASMFTVVEMKEPATNLALQVLIDESVDFEQKYEITIQMDALKRIIEFAPKIEHERVMPDKGIELLNEAIINAKSRGLNFLDSAIIDELLSDKIGVNVGQISQDEAQMLQNLEEEMHKRVVGQEQAIRAVSAALRRGRSGLSSGNRPVASFLFFGPTGVGKTEVAKTLAATYYGDEKMMIRLDMSEYQEQENLNRLIGYTDKAGNFYGGYLTEAVRSRPFSVILLDELEKANAKVLDLFLQVLDEGNMTDGAGRKVDFTNAILIATSNAASSDIANHISKGEKYEEVEKQVLPKLREVYRVEFLNRFDKVIMFKPLTAIEVEQIAEIMLNKINKRIEIKGISIKWNERTVKELVDLGYDPVYGARELRRVIQEKIEDELANLIILGKLKSGQVAVFNGLNVEQII